MTEEVKPTATEEKPTEAPVAPAVEAPVEAPAAPVVEQPKVEEPPAPAPTPRETGNAVFDQAAGVLVDRGMSVDAADALLQSVATDKLSLADHAKLVDELGEGVASMMVDSLKKETARITEAAKKEVAGLKAHAAEVFGLEAEQADAVWSDIQQYVKDPVSGFSDEDRAAFNTMIKAGGAQARIAVEHIANRVNKGKTDSREPELVAGDRAAMPSAFEPINKTDYVDQMREVAQKYGSQSREADELRAKREQSIARGY